MSTAQVLKYVPDEIQNSEFFIDLIQQNIKIMSIVPKNFKTNELYKVAANYNPKYISKIL